MMKGKKRFVLTTMFLVNIIMLAVTVFPHHHHSEGVICTKQDLPDEEQCPIHHHPEDDSCCSFDCMTRFHSPTPPSHTNSKPDYVFVTTLFTDFIIEHLLQPLEKRMKDDYVFRDSLHGADFSCVTGLRAPPLTVLA